MHPEQTVHRCEVCGEPVDLGSADDAAEAVLPDGDIGLIHQTCFDPETMTIA